ncbi:MAG TPA: hypothetical protein VHO66_10710 [Ruminiclostridium sp.]|nr:hypothetical protein [Ruminiclostridium sp.]
MNIHIKRGITFFHAGNDRKPGAGIPPFSDYLLPSHRRGGND